MDLKGLMKNYSGKNIKAAIIDCGVDDESFSGNISHYTVYPDRIEKLDKVTNYNKHGSNCARILTSIAKDINLVDIKVINQNDNNLGNIVKAIKLAIDIGVDVINISLGMTLLPDESLEIICKEAFEKNIIIVAAGYGKNISTYPADYDTVLRVDVDESIDEGNIYWDGKSYLTNPKYEITFSKIEDNMIKVDSFSMWGSSYACAYIAGIMCLISEALPISTAKERELFLRRLVKEIKGDLLKQYSIKTLDKICSGECVIVPSFNEHKLLVENSELLNPNIIGYYDPDKKSFMSFKGASLDKDDYKNIIVANSEFYKAQSDFIEFFLDKGKKIYLLGAFTNNIYTDNLNHVKFKYDINLNKSNCIISQPSVPIIGIFGSGWSRGKFDVQLALKRDFQNKGYKSLHICTNPLGILFDMIPIDIWDDMDFPSIVYKINLLINEITKNNDVEILTINVGGGVLPFDGKKYNHYFGATALAFLYSSFFDTYILCANSLDDINYLNNSIKYLETVSNTVPAGIVISDKVIDYSTLYREDGFLTRPCTQDEIDNFEKELKKYFNYPILTNKQINNGGLSELLINILSS